MVPDQANFGMAILRAHDPQPPTIKNELVSTNYAMTTQYN